MGNLWNSSPVKVLPRHTEIFPWEGLAIFAQDVAVSAGFCLGFLNEF